MTLALFFCSSCGARGAAEPGAKKLSAFWTPCSVPFLPDDGPDRGDLPRALRRRTDIAYDTREPHYDPADRE
eukprot:13802115-Alexandrium_andersonii.AAC.1